MIGGRVRGGRVMGGRVRGLTGDGWEVKVKHIDE